MKKTLRESVVTLNENKKDLIKATALIVLLFYMSSMIKSFQGILMTGCYLLGIQIYSQICLNDENCIKRIMKGFARIICFYTLTTLMIVMTVSIVSWGILLVIGTSNILIGLVMLLSVLITFVFEIYIHIGLIAFSDKSFEKLSFETVTEEAFMIMKNSFAELSLILASCLLLTIIVPGSIKTIVIAIATPLALISTIVIYKNAKEERQQSIKI